MKKIVASVGLVALGASAVQTASAQELAAPDNSKPWSVSATLRGFYDDNTTTWPNSQPVPNGYERGSWGFQAMAGAALKWSMEQTTISLDMVYSFKYYEDKPINSTDNYDQTFQLNAGVHHNFSERYQLDVTDSFVVGQEPDFLRAGNTFSTYNRVSGDNFRNYGTVLFNAELTPEAAVQVGFANAWYDYSDSAVAFGPDGTVAASLAGLLNRIEFRPHADFLWKFTPEDQGVIGYQWHGVSYTADQIIATTAAGTPVMSDSRNTSSHQMYVGLNHTFTPELSGQIRLGGQITDYVNDSNTDNVVNPYARLSLRYTYATESWLEGGFTFDRTPTDLITPSPDGSFTLDAKTAAVYVSATHSFTPKIFGTVLASFQDSMYNGGTANDQAEQFYLVGLNLEYRFNRNFSANVGYNYDNLQSPLGRAYDRNRVFFGVTASY